MDFILSPWTVSIALAATIVVQSLVLRSRYQRKVARVNAKLSQFQNTTNAQMEQARRQIGQLQLDLSATRLQLKKVGRLDADVPLSTPSPAREALERAFDSAPQPRLPDQAFADTQPSRQFTRPGDLLIS